MYKIMAVNAGSSSLKFKLYNMPEEETLCSGIFERIGHDDGIFTIKYNGTKDSKILPLLDHAICVELLIKALLEKKIISSLDEIKATGHRIVQGGKYFDKSAKFDNYSENLIEALIPLAPLHNSAHLVGLRAFRTKMPSTLETVTFDTAFHQTMDAQDYTFAIPYKLAEKYDIRRYGAHGTSHRYVSEVLIKEYLNNKKDSKIISCHLGSGSSITAIKNGKCVATSMGLTPLGGVVMGTRCGDIDPSVFNFLVAKTGKSAEEIYQILNKESGLLGVSGLSNDARDIEEGVEKGNPRAILAQQLFVRRVADYIGQYFVRLGGCDAIIFTAGIGENSAILRKEILDDISSSLKIKYDVELNAKTRGSKTLLSLDDSAIKVVVIPTDEEVIIARDAYTILMNKKLD
ncbi:MAG: acetate kinase [Bacilli bacterium]